MILRHLCLLAVCASLAAAVRIPPLSQADELCARQALYQEVTDVGSLVIEGGEFAFVPHARAEHAVAWGSFLDGAHTVSNFGQLRISTSGNHSDGDQVFAAGFLEGHLTAPRIHQNFENLHTYFVKTMNASLEAPMAWISRQDAWVRGRCAEEGAEGFGVEGRGGRGEGVGGHGGRHLFDHHHEHRRGRHEHRHHGRHHEKHHEHKHHDRGGGEKARGEARRYWQAVCLAIRQYDGVVAGYRSRAADEARAAAAGARQHALPQLSPADFLFLESNGDLYDIIDSMDPSQRPSWAPGGEEPDDGGGGENEDTREEETSAAGTEAGEAAGRQRRRRRGVVGVGESVEAAAARLFRRVALSGKCSALITLAPDLSDLFMGHSTWDSYTAMLRIYKHYSFDLRTLAPAAQRVSFSSYPGEVFSDDDFFLLSSGLVVLQTTNKIFNDALFDRLTERSVLSWQRVRAANWLARGGEEWARVLDTHNSGSYNNQYMMIDLKAFVPGKDPGPGLLWVAEQIPGLVVAADMTPTLALGYWPSHNVPAFPEIYNASGYPDFISKLDKYGQHFSKTTHWLSWTSSPRAKIFRRDHSSVTTLEGMKALMRSNNWRNDPYSEGHPVAAVCGRGDLDPSEGLREARGCYDTKVTSWRLALKLQAEAVNGPTRGSGGALPAFSWADVGGARGGALLHSGQPARFDFAFELMAPDPLAAAAACAARGAVGAGDAGLHTVAQQ